MALPNPIRKLDPTVVNRIAAGEVIQRPANALKEMLENSLDANATNIQISAKNGGMKLLQIVDNGSGIRKEDLEIVCERFTTSKLRKFEDLTSIATYGFRGEGLASISHVAHLTIITKTGDSQCAFKVSYLDGKMKAPPKPCAGNQGTQIIVEDLFYNLGTRRKALKTTYEEYAKIADVVGSYAVHNSKVGFSLKKIGESSACIRTQPNSSCVDNICSIFGNSVSRELLDLEMKNDQLCFKIHGQITNANYSTRKLIFLLFINNRLVDSVGIRKIVDQAYSNYLPKGGHPFIYLSLEINPNNVDVNVHPTKHEVHFLHEEEITEKIREAIEMRLLNCNTSRVFYTQARLPTVLKPPSSITKDTESRKPSEDRSAGPSEVAPSRMVRTDSSQQKMQKFLSSESASQSPARDKKASESHSEATEGDKEQDKGRDLGEKKSGWKEVNLYSILTLRKAIEDSCHSGLRGLLKDHSFVGCVSRDKALVQHHTSLYLCNTSKLCEELFYQIMMYQFGNFGMIKFSEPVPLYDLGLMAIQSKSSGWTEADGSQTSLAEFISCFLSSKSAMLLDYFSISIDPDGALLQGIPILIDGFFPRMEDLPLWVLRLATEVEWGEEKMCFETLCRETAKFYALNFASHLPDNDSDNEDDDGDESGDPEKRNGSDGESQSAGGEVRDERSIAQDERTSGGRSKTWRHIVEHDIYSSLRKTLLPPKHFSKDGTVLQVAHLPDLYKVFERC
ncbi:DNA mismatch repair protein Mlh1 [Hetaerina americana]|uniref:DNA mismatch repair protein Mlh1 n=1 Tax=Hetaerina americana TaxID=62018 RepID=UPI003A7F2218